MLGWCLDLPRRSRPHPPIPPGSPTSWLIVQSASLSPHTAKAYRQDFEAIALLVAGTADAVLELRTDELTKDKRRSAFAAYAEAHSAASIRRCWSTWNTLCTFLFTAELLDANPMPLIGRPKVPKSLPKSYPAQAVTDLVAAIETDRGSARRSDWPERDRAIVFTSLLAGLRADELVNANVGDIRRTDDGGVLHVRGKGNKDRRIPIGIELLDVLDDYLRTRTVLSIVTSSPDNEVVSGATTHRTCGSTAATGSAPPRPTRLGCARRCRARGCRACR
jgi:site-specific recombinase XerC